MKPNEVVSGGLKNNKLGISVPTPMTESKHNTDKTPVFELNRLYTSYGRHFEPTPESFPQAPSGASSEFPGCTRHAQSCPEGGRHCPQAWLMRVGESSNRERPHGKSRIGHWAMILIAPRIPICRVGPLSRRCLLHVAQYSSRWTRASGKTAIHVCVRDVPHSGRVGRQVQARRCLLHECPQRCPVGIHPPDARTKIQGRIEQAHIVRRAPALGRSCSTSVHSSFVRGYDMHRTSPDEHSAVPTQCCG